jgi:hypothetical protein
MPLRQTGWLDNAGTVTGGSTLLVEALSAVLVAVPAPPIREGRAAVAATPEFVRLPERARDHVTGRRSLGAEPAPEDAEIGAHRWAAGAPRPDHLRRDLAGNHPTIPSPTQRVGHVASRGWLG